MPLLLRRRNRIDGPTLVSALDGPTLVSALDGTALASALDGVSFASALDGWGFTALQVAKVLLPKFPAGTTPKKVAMILFGDFCLNEGEGKVTKLRDPKYPDGAIFPKLVLEPLWALLSGETEDALGEWFVKPDSKRKQTAREAASTCLRTKFRVADAVCRAVVDKVAPPEVAFSERLPALLQSSESKLGPVLAACDRDGGAIVYVAKQILVNGCVEIKIFKIRSNSSNPNGYANKTYPNVEISTRGEQSSKNQPNRLRFDRARDF